MDAKLRPFIKTINPEDLPAEAWNIVLGKRDETNLQELYQQVSWLFRAVDIRCNGVKSVPFSIYQGEDEIDTSGDWQNTVKFLPNPTALFGLIEMALTIWGYGYLYQRPNLLGNRPYSMRYLPPTTVQLKKASGEYVLDDKGLPVFMRSEGGTMKEYEASSIVYFWKGDPFVEWGPPASSPARAAALAAGVALDVNLFASAFLQRGAIKPFLFTVKGPKKATELDKLKDFIGRIFSPSRQKSWPTEVINAEDVSTVIIGEGLEAIAGKEAIIGQSKREEIATAIGIPHSILFSGAANYSVSEKDDVHLYDKTVIPDCEFIAEVMNEQVFAPLGYKMQYHPEQMDIYQEDEEDRAGAMNAFMDAMNKAESLEMAQAMFAIFGFEVSDDAMKLIEAHYKQKDERREEFAGNLAQMKPGGNGNGNGSKPEDDDEDEDERQELNKWLSKIKHRWNPKTKSAAEIEFQTEHISPGLHGAILGMLESCKSISDVEAVFRSAIQEEESDKGINYKVLAAELKRANDLLEATAEPPAPVQPTVVHETINVHNSPPAVKFEYNQAAQPAPVVNNVIEVNPTPVTVENTVNVEPTPITVDNTVAIPPAQSEENIRLTVKRDRDGRISEVVEE